MTKITDLTAATSVSSGDLLPVVDVLDTTMAATGTDKKLSLSVLNTWYLPAALLAVANGVASLDSSGLVPVAQLPVATASLVLAGAGTPSSGLGLNGDSYINTSTGQQYAKASGAWTQNGLIGHGLLATTGTSGYTLVNGTGTICTWTAPNDGVMHRVMVMGVLVVATTEVGGLISLTFTAPGGTSGNNSVWAAAQTSAASPITPAGGRQVTVQPNTAVSLVQSNALTSGASVLYAELWGS